jgi:hypothetical protein
MPGGPRRVKRRNTRDKQSFSAIPPGRAGELDELYSQAAKTGAIGKARKAA